MHRIEQLSHANSVSVLSVQGIRASEVRMEQVPATFHEAAQKARPVTLGQEEVAQVQRYDGEQRDRDFTLQLPSDSK